MRHKRSSNFGLQISVFKYSAWRWSETRGQYYLHQFTEEQPDLNYNSPVVVQEIKVNVFI